MVIKYYLYLIPTRGHRHFVQFPSPPDLFCSEDFLKKYRNKIHNVNYFLTFGECMDNLFKLILLIILFFK